jgi:hypothetical protein
MKVFAFLAALAIVGLVITGAIKLQKSDNSISIQIDRNRVKEEAKNVVEKGEDLLRDAGSAFEEARDTRTER